MNWQGNWSSQQEYAKDDIVHYLGSSYICLAASYGRLPTNPLFWALQAQKGDKGEPGQSIVGPKGDKGDTVIGPAGPAGESIVGPKGDKGDKGDPGLSAYEVALENGFKGTEKEFLDALRGPPGPAGRSARNGTTVDISNLVPYTGATNDVDLGNFSLNAKSINVTGTNGSGHIHLKHQASDATTTGGSTTLFADASGNLKYKNDGLHYVTIDTDANTADRTYTFPDASGTVALTADLASYAPLASPTFTGTVTLPAAQVVNGVTLSTSAGASNYLAGDGTYKAISSGLSEPLTAPRFTLQTSTPSAASSGEGKLYARSYGGFSLPALIDVSGLPSVMQGLVGLDGCWRFWKTAGAGTSPVLDGFGNTVTGTATSRTPGNSFQTYKPYISYVSTAAINSSCGTRSAQAHYTAGNASNFGGYTYGFRVYIPDGISTDRRFFGLYENTSVLSATTNPGSIVGVSLVGVALDPTQTTYRIMHNDAAGSPTQVDTTLASNSAQHFVTGVFHTNPNGNIFWWIEVVTSSGATSATGEISTNKPGGLTMLAPQLWRNTAAGTASLDLSVCWQFARTPY